MTEPVVQPEQASSLTIVRPPEATVARFTEAGTTLQERADALVVESNEGVEIAKVVLDDIATLLGQVEGDLGGPKDRAYALWKDLGSVYKKHAEPLAKLAKAVKAKVAAHYDELDRLQRVKEAQEAAAQKLIDDEARLQEAAALDEAGDTEQAEEVLEEPTIAAPSKREERVSGIARKVSFSAEVTSPLKIAIAAVAGDQIAISIITDPMVVKAMSSAASKKAKALGAAFRADGVKLMKASVIAHRSG